MYVKLDSGDGNMAAPPQAGQPKPGTGIICKISAINVDYSVMLSCGHLYKISYYNTASVVRGVAKFGIADTIIPSNEMWMAAPFYQTQIRVPLTPDGSPTRAIHFSDPVISDGYVHFIELYDDGEVHPV